MMHSQLLVKTIEATLGCGHDGLGYISLDNIYYGVHIALYEINHNIIPFGYHTIFKIQMFDDDSVSIELEINQPNHYANDRWRLLHHKLGNDYIGGSPALAYCWDIDIGLYDSTIKSITNRIDMISECISKLQKKSLSEVKRTVSRIKVNVKS